MEYDGHRLRKAETTRSASVREVSLTLRSSRRVREPSVRQELIGYLGFAASISTAPMAAVGRDLLAMNAVSTPVIRRPR
jgi:hypothetical protein